MKKKNEIIILIVLVLVPVIIHLLYSFHICLFLESKWECGALLNYVGTIIAVATAYYGVLKTIENNEKNHSDDKLNLVKPYITIEKIDNCMSKAISSNFNTIDFNEAEKKYIASNLSYMYYKKYCFVINENRIECKKELSSKENEIILNNGIVEEKICQGMVCKCVNMMLIDLLVTNVGNKSAIKMSIGLVKDGEEGRYTEAICFNTDKPLVIRIFSSANFEQVYGKYYLSFMYYDIYGNEYVQKFEMNINKNEKNICCHSVDGITLKNFDNKIKF